MKAIILAGGRGERLRPLTADRPKCMVELAGEPIALHQLRWLARQGVDEVVFSCGYRWDVIEEFFGDGRDFGVSVRYAPEIEPLGRGGGLRKALDALRPLDEPIIALNGDVLTSLPLQGMVAEHRASGALATLLLVPYVSQHGIVDVNESGKITGFREKPKLPYWLSGGVYVIDPAIFELLPEQGDHETSTWPQLASQGRLHGYRYEGQWNSLDSVKDVIKAEKVLRGHQA